jgi:arylsulfatase A-like enzyme
VGPLPARAAAVLLTVLAALALAAAGHPERSRAGEQAERPNVIVVMTDDQTVGELSERTMPATVRKLAEHGTEFTRSFVSSPLCCPSRAGYLTGQYPHNSGVFDNEPGYPSLIDKDSTVYPWMQAAGYRTGHVGRWLLNYERAAPDGSYDTRGGLAPPAGIESWFGYVGGPTHYYGATFSRDGNPVVLGNSEADYTTSAINAEARSFVAQAASDPRPFFLTVAPLAPHSSNDTGPGDCGAGGLPIPTGGRLGPFKNEPLPTPPSFGEPKNRDKPLWVESRPKLTPKRIRVLRTAYRCALATLSTVDEGVAALVNQLQRQGELANTAIFFTSDNGYFFGEHRITLNKVYPYEEAIRVPLLARVPGPVLGLAADAAPPVEVNRLVNNLDLTATILELGGAAPCTAAGACRVLDGHSLLPLLRGERPDWSRGRGLLIQLGGKRQCGTVPPAPGLNNFYDAIRTAHHLYVELNRIDEQSGECNRAENELYDLRADPFQLRNRATQPGGPPPSALQASLAARLAALRGCAGAGCG